jgi:hypothetical protein
MFTGVKKISHWYENYMIQLYTQPKSVWKTTLYITIFCGIITSIVAFLSSSNDIGTSLLIGIFTTFVLFVLINFRASWSAGAIKKRCQYAKNKKRCMAEESFQQRILYNR